jgi:nucleoside phosphorylase
MCEKKILVSMALQAEFAPWQRLRTFRRIRFCGSSFHQANIGNAEIRVILTGVGARQADDLSEFAAQYRPDAGIVAGVAGGLKPGLQAGEILVAESVWSEDPNKSAPSDPRLLHDAVQCGATPVEQLLTVAHVVRTAEAKSALAHAGDAVEMESLTVMQRLSREMIPAVAIRVIADTARESVPYDFEAALNSNGQIRLWRLAPEVIIRPWTVAHAVQFGITCRRATMILAGYLDRFVQQLAAQRAVPPSLLTTVTQ